MERDPSHDLILPDAGSRQTSFARDWLMRFPRAIPAALFLAVAAITALSVFVLESNAKQSSRNEVREYAGSIASALERRGESFSSYLRAGAAMFSSAENVSGSTFRQFVAELRIDQNYRGAEGIGWVALVAPEELDAHVRSVRSIQPSFPTITAQLAPGRDKFALVTYFAPETARNRRALGFDMYSEAERAAAMDEAARVVMPTKSGRILRIQDQEGVSPGFTIFMPVFKPIPNSTTQGRELAGFLFSAFNAKKFLNAAIDHSSPTELGVRLYDGPPNSGNLLVSRSLGAEGTDRFEQPVKIANRDLVLVVEATDSKPLAPLSMLTLIFGLALASMLMLVMRLLAKQAIEDEERLEFLEEQQSIRNSLSRELNHRVKNSLANVLSIMSLTRRRSNNLDDFADSLEGRVRSLSATHDLLTGSDWGTTPIRAVIETELKHVGGRNPERLVIEGPNVELAPNDALSFGLAIHELATNAAKYGSLSAAKGSVVIRWRLETENLAIVTWTESGGPPVSETRKRGFGMELIEKVVAHELRHRVELEFKATGVNCAIGVPVRRPSEFQMRAASAPPEMRG